MWSFGVYFNIVCLKKLWGFTLCLSFPGNLCCSTPHITFDCEKTCSFCARPRFCYFNGRDWNLRQAAKESSGIILSMCPANERWRYNVTSSLIGWAHTQNDPRGSNQYKDVIFKTILRPSYLHNGISYTGKKTSLYWIRALDPWSKINSDPFLSEDTLDWSSDLACYQWDWLSLE